MDSGMIGKIEKAHRYIEERERFRFSGLHVSVAGDNSTHTVALDGDKWTCDCDYFGNRQECAHTMAVALMLDGMVPDRTPVPTLA